MAKQSKTATMFAYYVNRSKFTQKEIAERAGFTAPNIITMMKTGATRIPIDRIPALCKAINMDPKTLLLSAMTEYVPEQWAAIQEIMGDAITSNETEIVKELRALTDNADPKMTNNKHRDTLKCFAESLTDTVSKS